MSTYLQLMEAATEYIAEERPAATSPEVVADIMRPLCQREKQEHMFVLLLNTKRKIISIENVTTGLIDRSHTHAREIFRSAIVASASQIILAHNHPTGDPTPSSADIACTRSLIAAGKIIEINIIDHVIIGTKTTQRTKDYISFREENLI